MIERKCIVKGCKNYFGEGGFIGDLCIPCHTMLQTGDTSSTRETFIGKMAEAIQAMSKAPYEQPIGAWSSVINGVLREELTQATLPHSRSRAS